MLEFLDLKDEYSESDLESALVAKMESFLLELGGAFTFVGRQRRPRIGDEWYSVDLLFFHRRFRCLVVVDLKLGKFTHADAGQMHLYLNYAREHWMHKGENPPVGLILCAQKNADVARCALQGLPSKILAAQYRTALPDEHLLVDEIKKTRLEMASCRLRTKGTSRRTSPEVPLSSRTVAAKASAPRRCPRSLAKSPTPARRRRLLPVAARASAHVDTSRPLL